MDNLIGGWANGYDDNISKFSDWNEIPSLVSARYYSEK